MFTNSGIETRPFQPIFVTVGGSQTIDIRLQPAHAGWRLDRALADAAPTMSRERLKSLIRSGAVESSGKQLRDPAIKVRGGESVRVQVPEPAPAHNEAQDIPLKVVSRMNICWSSTSPQAWLSIRPRATLMEPV